LRSASGGIQRPPPAGRKKWGGGGRCKGNKKAEIPTESTTQKVKKFSSVVKGGNTLSQSMDRQRGQNVGEKRQGGP